MNFDQVCLTCENDINRCPHSAATPCKVRRTILTSPNYVTTDEIELLCRIRNSNGLPYDSGPYTSSDSRDLLKNLLEQQMIVKRSRGVYATTSYGDTYLSVLFATRRLTVAFKSGCDV